MKSLKLIALCLITMQQMHAMAIFKNLWYGRESKIITRDQALEEFTTSKFTDVMTMYCDNNQSFIVSKLCTIAPHKKIIIHPDGSLDHYDIDQYGSKITFKLGETPIITTPIGSTINTVTKEIISHALPIELSRTKEYHHTRFYNGAEHKSFFNTDESLFKKPGSEIWQRLPKNTCFK